jgi:uncharacterized membrane protein (UPF0127 family)
MNKSKIYEIDLKGETFKVAVASNEETRRKGLSGTPSLGNNKGLLFIFPEPTRPKMIMKDMKYGLDFIFLDKDWGVIQISTLKKEDKGFTAPAISCSMVLEIKAGRAKELSLSSGETLEPEEDLVTQFKGVKQFKHGGSFEMVGDKVYEIKEDDIKAEKGKMQILNTDGEVVANIDSGSRIFSRKHTKEMIAKLKKGDKLDLANSFIKILGIQDNQTQEYVEK